MLANERGEALRPARGQGLSGGSRPCATTSDRSRRSGRAEPRCAARRSRGIKAVEAGYSVLFLTLETLMGRLVRARHENRLERTLHQLVYPRVLILDELGYLPLTREEASLFFRLLVRRYERASLIVTSNKSFADWGEVFNDQVLATAILDRLLHHATTVNIKGDSYRLWNHGQRPGLARSP